MLDQRVPSNAAPESVPGPLRRVLIVDDDDASRRLLGVTLRSAGFSVEATVGGEEALRSIDTAPPDVVLLDFEMPGLDGAAVCGKLRADSRVELRELPVIMLTGHTGEAEEVRCLRAGANDFVTKPISREVLEARIHTQLRLRVLNAELRRQNEELARWRSAQEADLDAARATQQAIVPTLPPNLAGWEVRTAYQPLIQVGGDVYGWRPCGDGRWLFWLADATGHGAAAALFTTLTTLLFYHASAASSSPGTILRRVNEEFCEVFGRRSFMTACCATIGPDGTAAFANAGHPPILIRRADGGIETLVAQATILGFDKTMEIGEAHAKFAPGDAALLYTDGLYSLSNADAERMRPAAVATAFAKCGPDPECLEKTIQTMRNEGGDAPFEDDLSALLLRRL